MKRTPREQYAYEHGRMDGLNDVAKSVDFALPHVMQAYDAGREDGAAERKLTFELTPNTGA